jgi:hypothetical protein
MNPIRKLLNRKRQPLNPRPIRKAHTPLLDRMAELYAMHGDADQALRHLAKERDDASKAQGPQAAARPKAAKPLTPPRPLPSRPAPKPVGRPGALPLKGGKPDPRNAFDFSKAESTELARTLISKAASAPMKAAAKAELERRGFRGTTRVISRSLKG